MFGGFKNKLQEMQQKMEEIKARLETITVNAESAGGKIKVTVNGNRRITDIAIANDINTTPDAPQFREDLKTALNVALAQADNIYEAEMRNAASGMLPNLPGMFK